MAVVHTHNAITLYCGQKSANELSFSQAKNKVIHTLKALLKQTSLKSSSLLCCFHRFIFFTATVRSRDSCLAVYTSPVDPSPIFLKSVKSVVGSDRLTSSSIVVRNCSFALFLLSFSFLCCVCELLPGI